MKHIFETTVYHADTDCYGIVWHGTYLRFLEQARYHFAKSCNKSMQYLEECNILTPVVNINLKYKCPAKLHDNLIIETTATSKPPLRMIFLQKVINKETKQLLLDAEVTCVCTNKQGVLYRKMPQELAEIFVDNLS